MKIGVISDTHDQVDNILKMVNILNQESIKLAIHCGDWVAPFTLKFYEKLNCPIKGIFGNNDGDKWRHETYAKKLGVDVTYEERFLSLEIAGRKICAFHGDYEEIVDALVTCGKYDAVFHGHNHQKSIKKVNNTLSLNPGTLMNKTRPGVKGASFAIYDTKTNTAKLINLTL